MKKYKKKKKFKEGIPLIRNEKYPDSTVVKSGTWCVLKNIKSPTKFNIEWQVFCPGYNYQQNGVYPSKLFKRAPIWPEGTKLKYKKNNIEYRDWLIGAECIVVKPPTILNNIILVKVKWVKWDKSGRTPTNGGYYPWSFEAIE